MNNALVLHENRTGEGARALRAVSAANGIAVAGFVVALAFWTLSEGRRWMLWPLLGVLVTAAVQTDRRRQRKRGRDFTLSVAFSDAVLVASAMSAGLLLAAGGWLILAGALAVVLVQLCWFGRARALGGKWDAPFLLTVLLGIVAYASAQRPWSPSPGAWLIVTTAAATGATVGLVATVQSIRRQEPSGAAEG